MEDEIGHRQYHTTDSNIYLSFNVFISFSFHLYNVITDGLCVPKFSGLAPPTLPAYL